MISCCNSSCIYFRVGGRENFFHCPKCDVCLGITLKEKHKVSLTCFLVLISIMFNCVHLMKRYICIEFLRSVR